MTQINLVKKYISDMKAVVDKLSIYPRGTGEYVFDRVALALLAKAFGFCNACCLLAQENFIDEAYGLSRSLVECTATLRYLSADLDERDNRTKTYIDYHYKEKIYWLACARKYVNDPDLQAEIEQYAKQMKLDEMPIAARDATKHWSGLNGFMWKATELIHPLDGEASTEIFRKSAYAADYHKTSQYVHCSLPSLSNYCPNFLEPYAIECFSEYYEKNLQNVLFILVTYLYSSCRYALYGLGIEAPEELHSLFSDALIKLDPVIVRKPGKT
jgi:Family of unknown function (DUF5677)